ncbi:aldo/keto reductase [Paenibacillus chibensis]|uniref:Aldo/keto reductase n=1 Tax=Paenibacillus chibensis TaxID=59846 RepID=A0ABU6PXV7_9BACL|nr:aldo/keto reductase [Paenibacillus chibensis]MEC0369049.1 aldo/keto reductase [Paenibacillus chibensis]MED5019704.1 aldo/keto reductase [Paenibacillus chibensis]
MKHITDCTILNNGVTMPWLGFGTYQAKGNEVYEAVKVALAAGYRSIDTAAVYGNEQEVGKAIAESGIARNEIFVTTKVWNDDQGYDSTLRAFEESQKRLGLNVIDLYLIHWPGQDKFKDTWKAMERLYDEGSIRAIGVSNFHVHHLKELMKDSHVVPAVDQVELHPGLIQQELQDFCGAQGIQIEAWSPLMKGKLGDNSTLLGIAQKYGKTPAQIILRWDIQNKIVTIPKSVTPSRIRENADIFDFELSQDELKQIDALNGNKRVGTDPDKLIF